MPNMYSRQEEEHSRAWKCIGGLGRGAQVLFSKLPGAPSVLNRVLRRYEKEFEDKVEDCDGY